MITPTADFQSAAVANLRDPRARVEVTWSDPSIDPTISASANDQNLVNLTAQVADQVTTTPYLWAHLNSDLDASGDYKAMPVSVGGPQVGWYGATLSDAGGLFSVNPVLTVEFAARQVDTVTVACDTQYAEYPVRFTVRLYAGVTLRHSVSVTGNTSVLRTIDVSGESLNDIDRMTLEIIEWSRAQQIVKVTEFYSSVTEVYYDGDIAGIDILEEMDADSGTLPVGNISCNQCTVKLVNKDNRFRYGNTSSRYANLLKRNRRIRVWLGFKLPSGSTDTTDGDYLVETVNGDLVGYQLYGVYWSGDWESSALSQVVTTSGRDRMDTLRRLNFETSSVYTNVTLAQLAETVMTAAAAQISDLSWEIDTGLALFTVPVAFFPKQSYFQCLRDICVASRTVAYADRTGTIQIGKGLV